MENKLSHIFFVSSGYVTIKLCHLLKVETEICVQDISKKYLRWGFYVILYIG